jgi:hypothetical protein
MGTNVLAWCGQRVFEAIDNPDIDVAQHNARQSDAEFIAYELLP